MSGRCKSCNEILTEHEMVRKWEGSEQYCDLCDDCLGASDPDFSYLDVSELDDVYEEKELDY